MYLTKFTESPIILPEVADAATVAAAAIGAPLTLAALAPPPLPMFLPQGIPQPGAVLNGAGALPGTVFVVKKSFQD